MTRGTAYAALEIILWLLAAGIVGFAIGWLLRKWRRDRHVGEQLHNLHAEEERRRGKLQLQLSDCETKVAALAADLEHRTADLDRANIQTADREKSIASFQDDLSKARSTEMKLQAKVEDRESTIASLRSSIGKEDKQLASIKKELDSANGTIGTLRKNTDGYQNTIDALRADLDVERRKQSSLAGELEAASAEAAKSAASLTASRTSQETLQSRLAEQETAMTALRREREGIAGQLRDLETEHAACASEPIPVAAPAPTTEVEVTPVMETDSVTEPDPVTELPDKDVALAKVAEIAARTRGASPAVEDDLKKIHGVGPKLDSLLKSMDITSFRQVANFTSDDIQHVTAALEAFPGRIERDDWMTSAAEQHAAKYNEPI